MTEGAYFHNSRCLMYETFGSWKVSDVEKLSWDDLDREMRFFRRWHKKRYPEEYKE